ncbi:hypothetical protein J4573_12710 [Actinomadura barringtoniae]|uniref:Uncharacterized protein n=1 Tax=Actinomadura barringtoniae TaxID=1427535 RepID=A0A939P8J0_9ACTN|nr:hypothetical protein [Actinomadura barringtoniae]MBO2447957.1 hypothetical protein [Actinomadura barringtoniae]
MARQIMVGYGTVSNAALEQRLHVLEARVDVLTEALRLIAAGLEGTPFDEPDRQTCAVAARIARELLITQSTA